MADQFLETVQKKAQHLLGKLDQLLEQKGAVTDILKKLEAKTKVKKSHLALSFLALVLLCVMTNMITFLCDLVMFVLPIYGSVKAIESEGTNDDSRWLTYWICYAAFGLVEYVTWPLISVILTDYYLFKTAFFIWCMYPSDKFNGSLIIYDRVIRPLFLKYGSKIDSTVSSVEKKLLDAQQTVESVANVASLLKQN